MAEINNRTLVIAIQAVAAETRRLRDMLDDQSEAEDYQTLEAWERAAEDLESAYDAAARTTLNLPPYDSLVGQ